MLHRWPWISGTVTDDVGDVVAGAKVTVTRLGRSWRGITDAELWIVGRMSDGGPGPHV